MQLIPAVDVLGESAARLEQGAYDRVVAEAGDPAALVRRFASAGAPLVHVVDLDGARSGRLRAGLVARLVEAARPAAVQASGGVRSVDDALLLVSAGAERVIVGTAAFAAEEALAAFAAALGERLVVALDVRDGEVPNGGVDGVERPGRRRGAPTLRRCGCRARALHGDQPGRHARRAGCHAARPGRRAWAGRARGGRHLLGGRSGSGRADRVRSCGGGTRVAGGPDCAGAARGMRIGLVHPGEMGAAVGAALRTGGHEVLWASAGRSAATAARARDARAAWTPATPEELVGQLRRRRLALPAARSARDGDGVLGVRRASTSMRTRSRRRPRRRSRARVGRYVGRRRRRPAAVASRARRVSTSRARRHRRSRSSSPVRRSMRSSSPVRRRPPP